MAGPGNAFVIGGGSCTTLGNYTLTNFAQNGIKGLEQLLISEDSTNPVYLYILFSNATMPYITPRNLTIGVLLTNDTTSSLDTIYNEITTVVGVGNPVTSPPCGGYTAIATASLTSTNMLQVEVVF